MKNACAEYRRFVADGIDISSPWCELKNQVFLGSDNFVDRMLTKIAPDRPVREIPRKQRCPAVKPLRYFATQYADREEAISAAYRTGAYSMQAIADHFDVGRMTVSRAVKRFGTK